MPVRVGKGKKAKPGKNRFGRNLKQHAGLEAF
jgi:hypothetical protein